PAPRALRPPRWRGAGNGRTAPPADGERLGGLTDGEGSARATRPDRFRGGAPLVKALRTAELFDFAANAAPHGLTPKAESTRSQPLAFPPIFLGISPAPAALRFSPVRERAFGVRS